TGNGPGGGDRPGRTGRGAGPAARPGGQLPDGHDASGGATAGGGRVGAALLAECRPPGPVSRIGRARCRDRDDPADRGGRQAAWVADPTAIPYNPSDRVGGRERPRST